MRAFLALDLSPSTKASLAQVQDRLGQETVRVKWVEGDHMHVTLRFFADLHPDQQDKLAPAMADLAKRSAPFSYKVRGLGFFASGDRLRVLWCGIEDAPGRLAALHKAIDVALMPLRLPPEERAFRPHLTLGRLREPSREPQLVQALRELAGWEAGEERPDRLRLYQSTLTPTGPIYRVLGDWRFGGAA